MQVQNVFEPIVTDEGRMGPSFKLRLTGTRVRFITARTTNWKSFESIGLPTHDEAENCVKFFQLIFYLYSFHECNEKLKEGIMYSIFLFLNCLIKIQIRVFLKIKSPLQCTVDIFSTGSLAIPLQWIYCCSGHSNFRAEVESLTVNDQSFIFTFGQSWRPKTEKY